MKKEVKKQLDRFLSKEVDTHGIVPQDQHVIIRFFKYRPEGKAVEIMGMDGENLIEEAKSRLYNVALILATGKNSAYNVGELCSVGDYLFQKAVNPEWLMVREALKERPAPEITHFPEKYTLKLSNEFERYLMVLDKFSDELSDDDILTFCIPDALVRNRICL